METIFLDFISTFSKATSRSAPHHTAPSDSPASSAQAANKKKQNNMSSSKYAEETESKSSEFAAEAPRTPDGSSSRRSAAEVEAAATLEEELDDLNLYEDEEEEEESSHVSFDGFSSPLQGGASSPLAINLVGMSKTQDVETMLPFPTLAAREEEDAMGGSVSVVFSFFPESESITQNFGIGQTIQMLKGWLEKVRV